MKEDSQHCSQIYPSHLIIAPIMVLVCLLYFWQSLLNIFFSKYSISEHSLYYLIEVSNLLYFSQSVLIIYLSFRNSYSPCIEAFSPNLFLIFCLLIFMKFHITSYLLFLTAVIMFSFYCNTPGSAHFLFDIPTMAIVAYCTEQVVTIS